jgi:hypothetical protein
LVRQIRNALVSGLVVAEQLLAERGNKITLATEGGVFKGTSTAGTDIDTECFIMGKHFKRF